jgi:hypothetical protein
MGRPASVLLLVIAACSSPVREPPHDDQGASIAHAPAAPPPRATAAPPGPPPALGPCADAPELAVFASPETPWTGAPLRVMVVADRSVDGELVVLGADGAPIASSGARHGGPPYWWAVDVASPAAGAYRAGLAAKERWLACRAVEVGASAVAIARATGSVWPVRAGWARATENLYSAWIERLFDAPLEEQPSWPTLEHVLRIRERNFLFDHLDAGEDDRGLALHPDCADLPYVLRAYFAWKLGLPFGYSTCTRGGGGQPPACSGWHPAARRRDLRATGAAASFVDFARVTLADAVHSGTGRAPADADLTDTYPVALTAEALRPGAIYADPYGHVLVVARRVAQTPSAAGVLLAVDGQPDGTIARKRYWQGNFLYADDPSLGSPGFKRFRPVVAGPHGALRPLTNAEIARDPAYGDFSLAQYDGGVRAFYDRMDDVLSPAPLDPRTALLEKLQALEEQVRTRVVSIENGRAYALAHRDAIDMPKGPAIFETTGPWEDFSTPSRDLRLLIAIDVVRGFPEAVARRPERYAMPPGASIAEVRAALERTLEAELASRRVTYTRSDGSPFELSLAEVVARSGAFEVAYDPNDCVERRWGAPDDSAEASTCRRVAPARQRARMRRYRAWFHERRRPPRP